MTAFMPIISSTLSFGNVSIDNPHLVLTHAALVRGADSGPQTGTLLRNADQTRPPSPRW